MSYINTLSNFQMFTLVLCDVFTQQSIILTLGCAFLFIPFLSFASQRKKMQELLLLPGNSFCGQGIIVPLAIWNGVPFGGKERKTKEFLGGNILIPIIWFEAPVALLGARVPLLLVVATILRYLLLHSGDLLSSVVPPDDPRRCHCCLLPIPTQSPGASRTTATAPLACRLQLPSFWRPYDELIDPQTRLTLDGSQWLARRNDLPGRDPQPLVTGPFFF